MAFARMVASAALLASASCLPSLSQPNPLEATRLDTRAACSGNTATTRSEWCDYSIDTDYSTVVPDTGVTREYWLDLTEVTVAPDGVSRSAMAVNGTIRQSNYSLINQKTLTQLHQLGRHYTLIGATQSRFM